VAKGFFLIPVKSGLLIWIGGVVLTVFFKVLSVLIVAVGAFLVYGAGFLAGRTKTDGGIVSRPNHCEKDGSFSDDAGNEYEDYISRKSLSFKQMGLLLIMLGSISVLIAFR
jgi:hypothetical protein